MHRKQLTLRSRLQSFKYALEGLLYLFRNEPNAWLHLTATIMVTVLGIARHLTAIQWVALSVAVAIVWITETINTAIEVLCDKFCEGRYNEHIKTIKDVSAGAVLVAALLSITIATAVFLFT